MKKNYINKSKQRNKETENERLIYTVQEVAMLLHSSPNYIYLLIERGYLPAIKLGSMKILKSTLEQFLIDNQGNDLSNINQIERMTNHKDIEGLKIGGNG